MVIRRNRRNAGAHVIGRAFISDRLDSNPKKPSAPETEPMPYELIWDGRGAYVRFSGRVSAGDMTGSVERMVADHRFDNLLYRINDYRDVTALHLSTDDIEIHGGISWATARSKPRGFVARVAHVTTDTAVAAAIENYYSQGLSPNAYRIFTSLEAARAWVMALTEN